MADYRHEEIWVNSEVVRLNEIVNGTIDPATPFENETFTFIRKWLGEENTFHFQTSGSTGKPKTVTFQRNQLIQSARSTIDALGLLPSETSLICLHTKYVAGKMMLVRSLLNNMRIMAMEPDANPLQHLDPQVKIDFAAFVPLQVQSILESELRFQLNNIRNIIIGGAPLSAELRTYLQEELETNAFSTYGMTETITHIALERIGDSDGLYHVLPGVKIRTDDRGCLTIEAPFLDEPVVTNDLAEITSETSFRWLGRWDNIINTGGVKIIPEIVEEKILSVFSRLNIQQRFFIAGVSDKKYGECVTLFVEGAPFNVSTQRMVNSEMIKDLLKLEVPREIVFVDQFALTETGKINRGETKKLL